MRFFATVRRRDKERRAMEGFRNVMSRCDLGQLSYVEQWYNWERGNSSKTRIRERLDRFIVSLSWMQLFPKASSEHLCVTVWTTLLLC